MAMATSLGKRTQFRKKEIPIIMYSLYAMDAHLCPDVNSVQGCLKVPLDGWKNGEGKRTGILATHK